MASSRNRKLTVAELDQFGEELDALRARMTPMPRPALLTQTST